MEKNKNFKELITLIIGISILFTGITNGQVDNSTYTSRSCKVYKIEYSDNLQAYTSPDLKKQEYFINTDYFKRYVDSKNKQVPNCPINGGENLNSYSDTSSNQNRFTAPNGKIYFISQKGGEYTSDGLSNQKTFKTIDELKNYIKIRNPLAILNQNTNNQNTQQTYGENSNNQQHGSAEDQYNQNTQNQYNQNTSTQYNQDTSNQYDQNTSTQYNQDTSSQYNQNTPNQYNQNTQTENTSTTTYTTQLANCSGLPQNAYRINSKFTQTYYGTIRLPTSKSATYSTDSSVDCAFLCYSDYTRNSYNNTCEKSSNNEDIELIDTLKRMIDGTDENNSDDKKGETRLKECTGLPDNAKWINGEFKQTWNGSSRKPKKVDPEYSSDDEIECSFKCKTNYKRNSRTEKCEKKSSGGGGGGGGGGGSGGRGGGSSTTYSCQGVLPNNTSLNNPNAIPYSNINYFYDETSTSACAFKCNSNYTWNSNSQSCEQTTILACTGLPENAKRINSRFKLIWNGSSRVQNTTKNTCTNDSSSNLECSFTCNDNYKCNSDNSGCIPSSTTIQTANCTGTLPDNAKRINNKFTQTWNGSNWTPPYKINVFTGNNNVECSFICNDNYTRNGSSCVYNGGSSSNPSTYSCQGTLPANSHLNNPSATPSSNINYFYDTGSAACAYSCDNNYSRNGSSCVYNGGSSSNPSTYSCQGTLPANSHLNNPSATPSSNINYFYDTGSAACAYSCDNNYSRNGSSCVYNGGSSSNPSTYSCQGTLPANSHLNNPSATPSSNINYFYDTGSAACTYSCDNNYSRNGSSCVYNGGSSSNPSTYSCQGSLPAKAHLNNPNTTPSNNNSIYFYNPDSSEPCAFHCGDDTEQLKYNSTLNACIKEANCENLVNGGERIISKFSQTWDGSKWTPASTGNTFTEDNNTNIECSFKCKEHYTWDNNTCKADTRQVDCPTNIFPAHHSIINSKFKQTRNGNYWAPSTRTRGANYSNDTSEDCSFICETYYEYNSNTNKCDPTCYGSYLPSDPYATNINGLRGESYSVENTLYDTLAEAQQHSCSYICNTGYYKDGNYCRPYTCKAGPDKATLIAGSDQGLTNNNDTITKLCYHNSNNELVYKDSNNSEQPCDNNAKCSYTCSEPYEYDNGSCKIKWDCQTHDGSCEIPTGDSGLCGSQNGGAFGATPSTTNLCIKPNGTKSKGGTFTRGIFTTSDLIASGSQWLRSCQYWETQDPSDSESVWHGHHYNQKCSATRRIATCGEANSGVYIDQPSTGILCAENGGNYKNLNYDSNEGKWTWSCYFDQTNQTTCSAKKQAASCGIATEGTYTESRNPRIVNPNNICGNLSTMVAGSITRQGQNWVRYCRTTNNNDACDVNHYSNNVSCERCSAEIISCGSASENQDGYVSAPDDEELCRTGTILTSVEEKNNQWSWKCDSTNGGSIECTAKMGGCDKNSDPKKGDITGMEISTNETYNNSSTEYNDREKTADGRLIRSYSDTIDENSICSWSCINGYKRDGNKTHCIKED